MDKYEFNIRVEQIKKNVSKGDYETAMKTADTIDWKRVRNANLLSMVAQVYEKNEEYQEAKEILLLAFERAPIGKRLLFKLTELALREGSVEEAEAYYREFCDLAPEDSRQHLLRYMILKAKNAPAEQLIHSLEGYTTEELDEKWLYELAYLYHEAGNEDQCVKTCDKIMLMFGLGKYVEKAMELKLQYAPLTKYQMDLVENRDKYEAKLRAVEQSLPNNEDDEEEESYEPVQAVGRKTEDRMPEPKPAAVIKQPVETQEIRQEPVPVMEVNDKQDIVVAVKQAEVEEHLAEELSKISHDDFPEQEVPGDQTRVLGELKSIQMPASDAGQIPEQLPEERAARRSPEPAAVKKAENISSNYIVIKSRTPSRGLEAAVETLKKIHAKTGIKNPVAKITAEKLNVKGLEESMERLKGKDLIIEEAGDLSTGMAAELEDFINEVSDSIRVILIDNPKQIEMMSQKYPDLMENFTAIVQNDEVAVAPEAKETVAVDNRPVRKVVPERADYQKPYKRKETVPVPAAAPKAGNEEMDIDEFAQYATKYAATIDCAIPGKSMLALYERIEIMEEDNIPLTRANAEELVEEAADKAEKPSLGKMITGVFSSKYDKDGLLILKEEHFI